MPPSVDLSTKKLTSSFDRSAHCKLICVGDIVVAVKRAGANGIVTGGGSVVALGRLE